MSIFVIELNDAAVTVSDENDLLLESPGYAVMDADRLYLGSEAQDIARIRPRWTNNHFWARLGMDPMQGATPQVRHHADLAFAHLKSIWQQVGESDAEIVFAVPGSWSSEQLGLLLGFANELDLRVHSIVDAAAAAAASTGAGGKLWHLDISLHRILLTELRAGDALVRERVLVIAEEGLVHFNNLWANTIADQFVHATRFDPMHRAETEQLLHDCLPACLADLDDQGASVIELQDREKHYSVTVRRDQLVAAAASAYPRIMQQLQAEAGEEGMLLLSGRFAGFPGLRDALSVLPGISVETLEPGAAARGCIANAGNLRSDDESVHYRTELPRAGREAPGKPSPAAPESQPTHLLYRGQAWAVGRRPTVLALDGDAVTTKEGRGRPQCSVQRTGGRVWLEPRPETQVLLNGREVDDKVGLSVGDRLGFQGHEEPVQAISLVG